MRFTVRKYPKLEFFALIGIFSFLTALFIVLAALSLPYAEEALGLGIGFFSFAILLMLALLIGTIFKKADFFAAFTVDENGITVHHAQKGEWTLLWQEITDSGVLSVSGKGRHRLTVRYTYFSKKTLSMNEKKILKESLERDIICFETRDEILWAVRKYYPIPLDVQTLDVRKKYE